MLLNTPLCTGQPPTAENCPVQNTHGAGAEKLCLRGAVTESGRGEASGAWSYPVSYLHADYTSVFIGNFITLYMYGMHTFLYDITL